MEIVEESEIEEMLGASLEDDSMEELEDSKTILSFEAGGTNDRYETRLCFLRHPGVGRGPAPYFKAPRFSSSKTISRKSSFFKSSTSLDLERADLWAKLFIFSCQLLQSGGRGRGTGVKFLDSFCLIV